MDTLYTFWDKITHYKPESVYFWGLMNLATKLVSLFLVVVSVSFLKQTSAGQAACRTLLAS